MKYSYSTFDLQLKSPFTIAKFSRTSTPILLLELELDGYRGYGEASMVPYMGESFETAIAFLKKVDFPSFHYPFQWAQIHDYLEDIEIGNPAIKAAIDIALHDVEGKIAAKPCYHFFNADPDKMPLTTYTIGMDEPKVIIKKVEDALSYGFKLLKIKLGRDEDKLLIATIRSVCNLPLFVDANQGWTDRSESVEMTHWLKEQGVLLIEQPMAKEDKDGNAFVSQNSPIPIIGDEAIQRLTDLEQAAGIYHGINIKLMKCTGMYEAHQMILAARKKNLKILIGCMSETSVATLAGAALAPLCDWADLDGPFLTKNNPFKTPLFECGKYTLQNTPGLGLAQVPEN